MQLDFFHVRHPNFIYYTYTHTHTHIYIYMYMCARAHDLRNALIFVYVCGICPCGWTGHPPSLLSHPLSLSLYSISSGGMHLVYEFYAYFHHYEFHTNQPKGKNIFHPVRFVHLNSRIILWPVIIKKRTHMHDLYVTCAIQIYDHHHVSWCQYIFLERDRDLFGLG